MIFDKYQKSGAYHWHQLDSAWSNHHFNAPLQARYQAILKLLPKSVGRILDVGCGDGYLLYKINRDHSTTDLYGIDTDERGISLAREQLQRREVHASLQQVTGGLLPFSECYFDVVVFTDVLEHLENPKQSLNEIFRVLKKSGLLLLSTPQKQPDAVWDTHHVQEFSASELEALLSFYFQEVSLTACWPMTWFRLYQGNNRIRWAINALTRLGFNPFGKTATPSLKFGQLIARCIKH